MMPFHTRPIVQPLQRQVNVFVGFQFHHCQPPGVCSGEHVDHGAVGGGEGRNLRIQARWIESVIDHSDIAHHQRLQPSLRTQPPQWMLARSVGMANVAHTVHEFCEYRQVTIFQNPFLRAHAEHDLLACCERIPPPRPAARGRIPGRASEKRSPPPRARSHHNWAARLALSRSTRQVAPARRFRPWHAPSESPRSLDRRSRFPPARRAVRRVRTGATWPRHGSGWPSARAPRSSFLAAQTSEDLPPATFPACAWPAHVEPQNAEGERGIDGRLRLLTRSLPTGQGPSSRVAAIPAYRSGQKTFPDQRR